MKDFTEYPEYTYDRQVRDLEEIIKSLETKIEKQEKQLSLYGVSKRFCWLEMPKGKFSDSWDEETNSNFITQDVIDYANKSGFKLIEYKCLNDEKFEFYKQMRLK